MSEANPEVQALLREQRVAIAANNTREVARLERAMLDILSQDAPLASTSPDRARARMGLAVAKSSAPVALAPMSEVTPESFTTPEVETWWLPKAMREWCEAASAASQAPKNLAVASAMCAAAAVLQGRVKVRWKDGVEEPLCLSWFVFSGTGTRKTAIQLRAMQAIRAHQLQVAERVAREAKVIENKRRWKESQLSSLRRRKAPEARTPALTELMGKIRELEHDLEELVMPKAVEWTQGNVNPSLLPKLLAHNLEAEGIARLSVMVSEGSFLANLLGRHQGTTIVEEVLGAVNGEPMEFVRSSKVSDDPVKVRLPHSYMTLCQLLQPHLLDLLKKPELSDTGFVGRSIVDVLPSAPIKPDWDSPAIPDHVQKAWDDLLSALITQDVPDLVDLTIDAAAARQVREMYESVELDETGSCQRITGIICRLYAISDICHLVAGRLDGSVKTPIKAPEQPPRIVPVDIPKHVHVVADNEYDWLDEVSSSDYQDLAGVNAIVPENCPGPGTEETLAISDSSTGGHVELSRSVPCPALTGGPGARVSGVLIYLYHTFYSQRLQLVRSIDRPSQLSGSLATRVLRRLTTAGQISGTNSGTVKVRDTHRLFPSSSRPTAEQLYSALEELEQSGAIEWVPESLRKRGKETRYREFRLLAKPDHLKPVPNKETKT
jgi:hypothetical protein